MQSRSPLRIGSILAGALCCCLPGGLSVASAQSVSNVRTSLHPIGTQVGYVTAVRGKTAWVSLPHRTQAGAKVEFVAYSDGSDPLAEGTVRWASRVAPYEAYVADVHIVGTVVDITDYDDDLAIGAVTKAKKTISSEPENIPSAVPFAAGFYARVTVADSGIKSHRSKKADAKVKAAPEVDPEDSADNVEPVRANLAQLRALNSRTATAIAAAAERALVADPLMSDQDVPADEAVNYSILSDSLQRFRRLTISDPITHRILARLLDIAAQNNGVGARVPGDFLRKSSAVSDQIFTGGGGMQGR